MTLLDLDMVNMGPRTRRATRALKTRMQDDNRDGGVFTGSASDTLLKLVSKRGLLDLKSCVVGVPVALDVKSTTPLSDKVKGKQPAVARAKEELSLAEMIKDNSRAGDEGITKMVAKVGRWWFSRCYEDAALAGHSESGADEKSIFADERVLMECETWHASFKLVVAYAQKPEQARRRTASV